ncbi:hypothetical protein B1B00_04925 [Bacillus sp. DSM 27956]|nr:hypothetical protein B1B00_04925 [Bacillus sp. DSM 27956]
MLGDGVGAIFFFLDNLEEEEGAISKGQKISGVFPVTIRMTANFEVNKGSFSAYETETSSILA